MSILDGHMQVAYAQLEMYVAPPLVALDLEEEVHAGVALDRVGHVGSAERDGLDGGAGDIRLVGEQHFEVRAIAYGAGVEYPHALRHEGGAGIARAEWGQAIDVVQHVVGDLRHRYLVVGPGNGL